MRNKPKDKTYEGGKRRRKETSESVKDTVGMPNCTYAVGLKLAVKQSAEILKQRMQDIKKEDEKFFENLKGIINEMSRFRKGRKNLDSFIKTGLKTGLPLSVQLY